MTLEEAIKKASSGDLNSIIAVADYYMERGTVGECMDALEWYEKAASRGVKYASLKAAMACANIARTIENNDMNDNDEAYAYSLWNRGALHASDGIPEPGEDMSNFDIALEIVETCLYGGAVLDYINSRFDKAMEKLKMIGLKGNSIRANLLYALCIMGRVSGRVLNDTEKQTIQELVGTAFYSDTDYSTLAVVGSTRHMEQLIFARAAKLLSYFYEPQAANALRKRAYLAVTDDSAKAELA